MAASGFGPTAWPPWAQTLYIVGAEQPHASLYLFADVPCAGQHPHTLGGEGESVGHVLSGENVQERVILALGESHLAYLGEQVA